MSLSAPRYDKTWLSYLQRYQGLVGLAILFAVAFFLVRDTFYTGLNLANILNQLAVPGIMAVGMTFVILTGGIDLSVGSLLGLINCIASTWLINGSGLAASTGYALFIGIAIGATIGFLVSVTKLQPFVVTLAAMVSLRGIAFVYTHNGTVSGSEITKNLGFLLKPIYGVPISAWLMLALTALASLLLWKTVFGRQIYALGGNPDAARYAGLPMTRLRIGAYAINGLCVALAALVYTARNVNGDPGAGQGYELDAITAVVVGGTSLLGGYGGVPGTFVGALFIVCLNVMLILKGIDDKVSMGLKGIIILIAVYLQNLGRRT